MQEGFYWVICEEVDDQPVIAEWCDGEWLLPGFSVAFLAAQVEVIGQKIEFPQLT